jgi:hypothetical protein
MMGNVSSRFTRWLAARLALKSQQEPFRNLRFVQGRSETIKVRLNVYKARLHSRPTAMRAYVIAMCVNRGAT